MEVACSLYDVVTSDFIIPTIERLDSQINRSFILNVKILFNDKLVQGEISSRGPEDSGSIKGEVRILAGETAVSGRYKYSLQCIFFEDEILQGLSGIRLSGAIFLNNSDTLNKYTGFIFTYNEWEWGKKFRHFE